MRFLKPLDEEMLHLIFQKYKRIISVEEGVTGGLGSAVAEFATQNGYTIPLKIITLPDAFMGIMSQFIDLQIANY